jgi:uncharacterized protein (DUF2249 family)
VSRAAASIPWGTGADKSQTRAISDAPRKRHRRTQAALEELDGELYKLVQEHQPCTVRQVYYLAVTKYLCDKTQSGYNLVQRRLLSMRRAATLPYGWIADNVRTYYGHTRWESIEDFVEASSYLYHYDYWAGSPVSVEVWVESDSIAAPIRETVVRDWGLRLHVARGFSSETFLYKAGEAIQEGGRPTHVYVLSDFDPSGVSLAADIAAKLVAFSGDVPVTVERIALNGEQVRAWSLPTHGLKTSDKRAAGFKREHGDEACELEAVPPKMLRKLVSDAISRHVEPWKIAAAKQDEYIQRDSLRAVAERLPMFLGGLRDG